MRRCNSCRDCQMLRPCNSFGHGQLAKLKRELRLHLITAYCLGATFALSGPNWERIGAAMLGANYRHGGMDKFDCFKNHMAWSAKTTEQETAGAAYYKLLNLAWTESDQPSIVGDHALASYNADVVAATYSRFQVFRSLVLLRNHASDQLTLYEKDIRPLETSQYRWKKHFRKGRYVSAHGHDRRSGAMRFSVTLTDRRLFVADPIPADAVRLSVSLDTAELENLKKEFHKMCERGNAVRI